MHDLVRSWYRRRDCNGACDKKWFPVPTFLQSCTYRETASLRKRKNAPVVFMWNYFKDFRMRIRFDCKKNNTDAFGKIRRGHVSAIVKGKRKCDLTSIFFSILRCLFVVICWYFNSYAESNKNTKKGLSKIVNDIVACADGFRSYWNFIQVYEEIMRNCSLK